MLVLFRKVGQKVNIGSDVVVTVLGLKGNGARLGIEGPLTVPIHRNEVHERIHESLDPFLVDRMQDTDGHL